MFNKYLLHAFMSQTNFTNRSNLVVGHKPKWLPKSFSYNWRPGSIRRQFSTGISRTTTTNWVIAETRTPSYPSFYESFTFQFRPLNYRYRHIDVGYNRSFSLPRSKIRNKIHVRLAVQVRLIPKRNSQKIISLMSPSDLPSSMSRSFARM